MHASLMNDVAARLRVGAPRRGYAMAAALALLIAVTPLAAAAGQTGERIVDLAQIDENGGVVRVKGEPAPFTGLARETDEGGRVRTERRFNAGKPVAFKLWNKAGGLQAETVIGPAGMSRKLWFDNGNLEEKTEIVLDHGVKVSEKSAMYYEDGKPRLEIGFAREKLQGALREYAPDGALVRDETYDQGRMTRKAK